MGKSCKKIFRAINPFICNSATLTFICNFYLQLWPKIVYFIKIQCTFLEFGTDLFATMQCWWQSQNLSMDPVVWPSSRATFKVCSIVCMYLLELFMRNFGRIFHIFGSFVPYPEGQMFHAWKFHAKVLYSSTSETASFGTPGSCGGIQLQLRMHRASISQLQRSNSRENWQ